MRSSFSSVAILASSLLAREVFAAPYLHKREVVTDVVVVTEEVTVTQVGDGLFATGVATAIGTTTINGTPVSVSSTPAATPSSTPVLVSSTPAATPSNTPAVKAAVVPASSPSTSLAPVSHISAAVLIQETPSSTPKTTQEPPKSTPAPAVVPTTTASPKAPTTLVKVASSSPAPAPAPSSSPPSSSSSSGKKRGAAYNDATLLPGFASSNSQVSWAYNWASSTSAIPSGLEYVPLLWGMQDEFTSVWNAHADAALASGSSHLMSFNEPDFIGQANLGVSAAVAGYMQYMQPFASKAQLGTPAVTNGASPMGLAYLSAFITALEDAGGSYDFCAFHWYDSASNVAYFKNYMQEASTACKGKPIWVTEIGASGSADEQNTFLQTVMPWMDQQGYIERYAYFMVTPGDLISSGTELSTLGETFASFT